MRFAVKLGSYFANKFYDYLILSVFVFIIVAKFELYVILNYDSIKFWSNALLIKVYLPVNKATQNRDVQNEKHKYIVLISVKDNFYKGKQLTVVLSS